MENYTTIQRYGKRCHVRFSSDLSRIDVSSWEGEPLIITEQDKKELLDIIDQDIYLALLRYESRGKTIDA